MSEQTCVGRWPDFSRDRLLKRQGARSQLDKPKPEARSTQMPLQLRGASSSFRGNMNLSQVAYFLALADTLNFSEAAARCKVSQPSLTRAIQKLEDELGGPLLFRDGKDTRLTGLGKEIRHEFEAIREREQRIHALVQNSVPDRKERITIGISQDIGMNILNVFFKKVLESMPMIELSLPTVNKSEVITSLLNGSLDGCFSPDITTTNNKISLISLYRERMCLAFSKKHRFNNYDKIDSRMLSGENYIDRISCDIRKQISASLMNNHTVMLPRLRTDREDLILKSVENSDGVCFIGEHSVKLSGISLKSVDDISIDRAVKFVSISGSANSSALIKFRKIIQSYNWILKDDPDP